ncbi:craniofacial development protein 2-like isoform X2 [Uranotaenia lowii]|nr:craniofacial development protein 2-like isoform X2 [Uranotaenia lowii]
MVADQPPNVPVENQGLVLQHQHRQRAYLSPRKYDDDKDKFYAQLKRENDRCPKHGIKIVIGDVNAYIGQEEEFNPTFGRFSAHQLTNENGIRLIDFDDSKRMAVRSTFFQHRLPHKYTWRSPYQSQSQIDHVLIDSRHFSNIIEVRSCRGANIESHHYLVMVKMRPKLSVVNNTRNRRPPRLNITRLEQPGVAADYALSLEAVLPAEGELNKAPLEDCCCGERHRSFGTNSTERLVRREV